MVEIIPKLVKKAPLLQTVLFYSSIAILMIAIIVYFILGIFLKKSSENIAILENELKKDKTAEEKNLEDRVLGYQEKIKDFSKLIEDYQQTSEIFYFIQKLVHPRVWFSEVEFNRNDGQILVGGSAESFETLGQQFLIFKNNSLVKDVSLANILIKPDGKIDFTLRFRFDSQIFAPKTQE